MESRAGGIRAFAQDGFSIVDPAGPATILVPSESVRLLSVDLPLASRAKRLQALPFAIEERIAEAPETVHLALGDELGEKRYLVAVVAPALMGRWIGAAAEAGLGHAAMVPDCLSLPVPPDGHWAVDLSAGRALVRAADGTGFALPGTMLEAAWRRAGEPETISHGEPLPDAMRGETAPRDVSAILARPALDLRQGIYARRALPSGRRFGLRLAWIVGIGVVAHATIATADTLMLRSIADRREAEARALAQTMAPGAAFGDDLTGSIADRIPAPTGNDRFVPTLARVSGALAPLSSLIAMRSIRYRGDTMLLDMDSLAPDALPRLQAALSDASLDAAATAGEGGAIRIAVKAS